MQTAPAQDAQLTEIPGKATTERLCSQCHTLESVTNQRHTREEWNGVIGRMIGQGLVAPEEELYEVSDYLTKYYGPPAA
jgi:cytochrome c2